MYRPNALTGDPNHLGIMLLLPLLVISPVYLRLEPGHRLRRKLAVLIAFLLLVELATLSRSGALGLIVGALVLVAPYRRLLWTRAAALPLVLVAIPVTFVVLRRLDFFETVIRSRVSTSGRGTSTHFGIYGFIPDVLHLHPLFGLGYNNFSVYYEFVTGKTNWGPPRTTSRCSSRAASSGRRCSWGSSATCSTGSASRGASGARSRRSVIRSPHACGRSRGG